VLQLLQLWLCQRAGQNNKRPLFSLFVLTDSSLVEVLKAKSNILIEIKRGEQFEDAGCIKWIK
jgi:hypothetical protein